MKYILIETESSRKSIKKTCFLGRRKGRKEVVTMSLRFDGCKAFLIRILSAMQGFVSEINFLVAKIFI
jgi:hypothetical protein